MMAINFRGKVAPPPGRRRKLSRMRMSPPRRSPQVTGCGEADAGNYEDLMTYMPPDYATPSLIRRSVTGRGGVYTRAAEPRTAQLTNAEHLMGGTYGAVTNWASFAKARPLLRSARRRGGLRTHGEARADVYRRR